MAGDYYTYFIMIQMYQNDVIMKSIVMKYVRVKWIFVKSYAIIHHYTTQLIINQYNDTVT